MKNLNIVAVSTLVMIALSGCGTKTPTTSDVMRMHAQDQKEIGIDQKAIAKEWDRGSKLKISGEEKITEGKNLVESGEHDVTMGEQNKEQGTKDSAKGTTIMNDSKRVFQEKYPDSNLDVNK